jgi:hypothetical protein
MFTYKVAELNAKITAASKDKTSPLYRVPPVVDPSNEMAEVLVQALEWNMLSREWNINVRDLALLHQKSKALLQTLKTHLPDRVGGANGWNFEKAHSILHKVREIVMWGWAENTSCQGPEHAHIELIKSVAHLTNNKDVFLCILRFHCRCGLIQQYQSLYRIYHADSLDLSRRNNICSLALYNALQCVSMTSQTRIGTSLRTWPRKHKSFQVASACGPAS